MSAVLCAVIGLTERIDVYMDVVLIVFSLLFVVVTFFAEGAFGFIGFLLSFFVFGFSVGLFASRWIQVGKIRKERVSR